MILNTKSGEEEMVGGRDERTGNIIHVCSPYRYKRAAGFIEQALGSLTYAVNDLTSIVFGSDHHRPRPFEHRDRQQVGSSPRTHGRHLGRDPREDA
jgi:hypothetical protein